MSSLKSYSGLVAVFSSNMIVIYVTDFGKQRNTGNNEFPDIIAEIGESIQIHFAKAVRNKLVVESVLFSLIMFSIILDAKHQSRRKADFLISKIPQHFVNFSTISHSKDSFQNRENLTRASLPSRYCYKGKVR